MNDTTIHTSKRLQLDRRAALLIEHGIGDDDELLDGIALADWFGVSHQWPHQARVGGYGPPYIALGPREIRYKRDDVLAWLETRRVKSTAETPERRAYNRGKIKRADGRFRPEPLRRPTA